MNNLYCSDLEREKIPYKEGYNINWHVHVSSPIDAMKYENFVYTKAKFKMLDMRKLLEPLCGSDRLY